jgi:hypothetical protein
VSDGKPSPLRQALSSAHTVMTTHSRDWARDRSDAWLYGIVVGWDEASLVELAQKFEWPEAQVERLRMLRAAVEAAIEAGAIR